MLFFYAYSCTHACIFSLIEVHNYEYVYPLLHWLYFLLSLYPDGLWWKCSQLVCVRMIGCVLLSTVSTSNWYWESSAEPWAEEQLQRIACSLTLAVDSWAVAEYLTEPWRRLCWYGIVTTSWPLINHQITSWPLKLNTIRWVRILHDGNAGNSHTWFRTPFAIQPI